MLVSVGYNYSLDIDVLVFTGLLSNSTANLNIFLFSTPFSFKSLSTFVQRKICLPCLNVFLPFCLLPG